MNPEKQDLSSDLDTELVAPAVAKLAAGSIFAGTYRILSVLGSGGMGTVYRAEHTITERVVAIKLLHQNLSLDADNLKRFQAEGKTLSQLNHANIVRLLTYGISDEGVPFIVMEELQGETLAAHLQAQGKLKPERIIALAQQLVAALVHAHHVGVIHRDLKPSNIMLIDEGQTVKVTDFGIAKFSTATTSNPESPTTSGSLKGSPYYMSPEQCRGSHLDGRSDLYALGCIMYQCLTGNVPFEGQTNLDIMYKQINDPLPAFAEDARDKHTRTLQTIIQRCLQKDPQDRYASAAKLQDTLSGQGSTRLFMLGRHISLSAASGRWTKVFLVSALGIATSLIALVWISNCQEPLPATPMKAFDEQPRQPRADPTTKTTSMWIDDAKRLAERASKVGADKGHESPEFRRAVDDALDKATNAILAARQRKHLPPEERLKLEAKALHLRAGIYSQINEFDKSIADLDRAISLSSQCPSQSRAAHLDLVSVEADHYLVKRDIPKALALSTWVLAEQEKLYGDTPTEPVCRTLRQLFEINHHRNEDKTSIYYAERLWKMRKNLSLPGKQATALGYLTQAYLNLPDGLKAIETAKLWVQMDDQTHTPDYPSRARVFLGYALVLANRSKEEVRHGFALMNDELKKCLRKGCLNLALETYMNLESGLSAHKQLKELITVVNTDVNLRRRMGKEHWSDILSRLNIRTEAYLTMQDFAGAERSARDAIAEYRKLVVYMTAVNACKASQNDTLSLDIHCHDHLISSLIHQHKYQECLTEARSSKERLRQLGKMDTSYYWQACIAISHALLALGDSKGSEQELIALLQSADANVERFPSFACECCRVLAEICDARGNTAGAKHYRALHHQFAEQSRLLREKKALKAAQSRQ